MNVKTREEKEQEYLLEDIEEVIDSLNHSCFILSKHQKDIKRLAEIHGRLDTVVNILSSWFKEQKE